MPFPRLYTRRPVHTPDRMLNVYLACRHTRPATPGLLVTLLHASARWYRHFSHRHDHVDPR